MISVEGVAPSVGTCGIGKEEDGVGGVWITSPYQRGRAARRRVTGEEAALQEEGSPVRRRRCKKKGSR